MEDNYKSIQSENYSLRDYIIRLQSRLIESHGDFPQPPANINLSNPRLSHGIPPSHQSQHSSIGGPQSMQDNSVDGMAQQAISALQASAQQAVAESRESLARKSIEEQAYLAGQEVKRSEERERGSEGREREAREAEELSRQLQAASADGLPDRMNL